MCQISSNNVHWHALKTTTHENSISDAIFSSIVLRNQSSFDGSTLVSKNILIFAWLKFQEILETLESQVW